jgi:phage tail-like protein
MPNYYPPVSFHFRVEVLGLSSDNDTRFAEAGGLSLEFNTEEVAEGGENRYLQRYPVVPKYSDLVLKRGLLVQSAVFDWVTDCLQGDQVAPKNVDVTLLNEEHEPLMTWHVINAYPIKWGISDFNATGNTVLLETLTFAYQYFTVDRS